MLAAVPQLDVWALTLTTSELQTKASAANQRTLCVAAIPRRAQTRFPINATRNVDADALQVANIKTVS